MMNQTIKRMLAFTMACALLLCGAQALAEQVYVTGSVAVYDQPDEGADRLGTLEDGAKVDLVAEKGGWAMIEKGGAKGFVRADSLAQADEAKPTEAKTRVTAYAAVDGAKVYDSHGNALGSLPVNTEVTVTGISGSVCRVEKGGHTAYMLKRELSAERVRAAEAPATEAETTESEPVETISRTAYVKTDGAKVFSAAGKVIGTLPVNTELTVTAVRGDICRVEKAGRTAYMLKGDLSDEKIAVEAEPTEPEPAAPQVEIVNETAYVKADGAKVYSGAGKVIGTLPMNTELTVTAVRGDVCRVEKAGHTAYMMKADLSNKRIETEPEQAEQTTGSTASPARGKAVEMDWWTSDIQNIFARGVTATITDVDTGLSWKEQRRGGTNHADCQPLTAADTAALKQAYGGKWSWDRRAIIVTINGKNYAASMNGMPHGGGSITDNNFPGHHCIHFTNSRTHGSNRVCPLHQAAIKKAAAAYQ